MKLLCLRVADTKGTLTRKVCLEAQSAGGVEEVRGRRKARPESAWPHTDASLIALSSDMKFCTELCSDRQEAQI